MSLFHYLSSCMGYMNISCVILSQNTSNMFSTFHNGYLTKLSSNVLFILTYLIDSLLLNQVSWSPIMREPISIRFIANCMFLSNSHFNGICENLITISIPDRIHRFFLDVSTLKSRIVFKIIFSCYYTEDT